VSARERRAPGTDPGPGTALLEARGLTVDLDTVRGRVRVVDDLDLTVLRGRTMGLVGESGSGKSISALGIVGLLPPAGQISGGRVVFNGDDLVAMHPRHRARIRGRDIGMIFQEPSRNLDPSFTVGYQIAAVVRRHWGWSRKAAWRRAVEMLDMVGIARAGERAHSHPHQLSGGMCQRVMIAIALVCEPQLLIADEPTTALDVTVQAQILALLGQLQAEMGLGILFITHDLGIVAELCDDVSVMYAGQVVEQAPADEVFARPRHPYTEGLLVSIPDPRRRQDRLRFIPGRVPTVGAWPVGCRFAARCAHATEACVAEPVALGRAGDEGGLSRCIRAAELALEGIA